MTIMHLPLRAIQGDLLTARDVASYLKLNPATVVRWCQTGYLPAAKLGKAWRIRKTDLEHWLSNRLGFEWGT